MGTAQRVSAWLMFGVRSLGQGLLLLTLWSGLRRWGSELGLAGERAHSDGQAWYSGCREVCFVFRI